MYIQLNWKSFSPAVQSQIGCKAAILLMVAYTDLGIPFQGDSVCKQV